MQIKGTVYSLTIVLSVLVLDAASASSPVPMDFPLTGEIKGTAALLAENPSCILVGEMHGTIEIPLLVSVLVRSVSSEMKTVLCLEIPNTEEKQLNIFLKSDGSDEAVQAVLSSPHWSSQDGRAGQGHFSLLELSRRLVDKGRKLHVAAIDINASEFPDPGDADFSPRKVLEFARKRDKVMAENVEAVLAKNPGACIVVLVGNVHASLDAGMPWDAEYQPMGTRLKRQLENVISLNAVISEGEAWVSTNNGVGPTRMSGENLGETPFVELFGQPTKGYCGILYVGKTTAAPPVHRSR